MADPPYHSLWHQSEWAFEPRPADEAWPPLDADNSWFLPHLHTTHSLPPPSQPFGDDRRHHHTHLPDTHLPAIDGNVSHQPDILDAILNNDSSALPTESARRQLEAGSSRAAEPPLTSARAQQRPVARHRDDWLDHTVVEPDATVHLTSHILPERSPHSAQSGFSELSDDDFRNFLASRSDSEEEPEAIDPQRSVMPSARRTVMSVVDLTAESPPMTAASTSHDRKRERRVSTSTEGRSQKRKRPAGGGVEEIGLAEDATTAEEDVLRAQQIEAIRSQQVADDDDGLQRIGQRQCVICMENFTNITATHCGHFYCHECLIRSLVAGEKTNERNTGNCPICRKSVSRTSRNGQRPHIIPISFMKKETFERNKRRRMTHDDESYQQPRSKRP